MGLAQFLLRSALKVASQVALVVKNPHANEDKKKRDAGSMPEVGSSPGGGYSKAPKYSCLENPIDRGGWPTTVHRVTKSRTRLRQLSMHMHTV